MIDDEETELGLPEEHSVDTAVPVETAQTRPKSLGEVPKLGDYDFEELKNKFVAVQASGYRYRGTLVGADERDLYLKGVTRWWVLPLDRVSGVRLLADAPPSERRLGRKGPIPGDPDPSLDDGEPIDEPSGADDEQPAQGRAARIAGEPDVDEA